jgi:hypothetical protein
MNSSGHPAVEPFDVEPKASKLSSHELANLMLPNNVQRPGGVI